MRRVAVVIVCSVLAGCASGPAGVVDKVLQDFGVRDRPEGYLSGADRVFERLGELGKSEIKRMNMEARNGEIKFEDTAGLRAKYYKEVKVYENSYPLDASPTSRTTAHERGYVGYIEYSYRVFQSPRKSNRTEAAAERATIPTYERGREKYRYRFSGGGLWSGGKGEKVK